MQVCLGLNLPLSLTIPKTLVERPKQSAVSAAEKPNEVERRAVRRQDCHTSNAPQTYGSKTRRKPTTGEADEEPPRDAERHRAAPALQQPPRSTRLSL